MGSDALSCSIKAELNWRTASWWVQNCLVWGKYCSTHLVIRSESSAVNRQKTEECFFPKQALKRCSSAMPEAVVLNFRVH